MRRGLLVCFAFLFLISLSFVSSFSFSEFLNKITGKISSSECSGQWIPEYSFCCGGNGESVSKQTSQKNGVSCCWGGGENNFVF